MVLNKEFKFMDCYHEMIKEANKILNVVAPEGSNIDYEKTIAMAFYNLLSNYSRSRLENIYGIDKERLNILLEHCKVAYYDSGSNFSLINPKGYQWSFEWKDGYIYLLHGPF